LIEKLFELVVHGQLFLFAAFLFSVSQENIMRMLPCAVLLWASAAWHPSVSM
jgi:hypothetical protein